MGNWGHVRYKCGCLVSWYIVLQGSLAQKAMPQESVSSYPKIASMYEGRMLLDGIVHVHLVS